MAKKSEETKKKTKEEVKQEEKAPEVETKEAPEEKPERYRAKEGYPVFYYKYGVIDHEWRELDGAMPLLMKRRIEDGMIEVESEVE